MELSGFLNQIENILYEENRLFGKSQTIINALVHSQMFYIYISSVYFVHRDTI